MEAAREGFEKALRIRREMAKGNPDVYLPDVAETLSNLAVLDQEEHQVESGRKGYKEALGIYEQLAAQNSDRFRPEVAKVRESLLAIP